MDFVVRHWELFAALGGILGLLALTSYADVLSGFKSLAPGQAVDLINRGGARILDVRPEAEFKAGHILDAVHVPYAEVAQHMPKLAKTPDKPLLIVCGVGQRPAAICKIAKQAGVGGVFSLRGGIRSWQEADLPLQKA